MFVNKTAWSMHIEAIKAVIERDMNDLQQIVNDIEVGQTISKIEAHLLKTKVQSLSEELSKLFDRITNTEIDKVNTADFSTKIILEPPKVEAGHKESQLPVAETSPYIGMSEEEKGHSKVEVIDNLKNESPAAKPSTETEPVVPEKKKSETPIAQNVSQKTEEQPVAATRVTLADKFSETNRSLNDRIGESKALIDRASMLSRKPISDIHKAIKLNDRVAFLRELFNGDLQKYQETINQLNQMRDFDEALNYIHQNFAWDQTNDTFKSFIEIVYRRFMN